MEVSKRRHKVAVATLDETRVCSHFGSANSFHIFTLEGGRVVESEVRLNDRPCFHTLRGSKAGCWDVVDELLPDVKVIITAGMGENAYVGILRRDILPLVTHGGTIQEAVQDYLHGRLKEDPERIHYR